mmetsp:Transcript_29763/g.36939  ORF Transcript_29763/g.36939 Transcript_29763/m.36939 type:complete len:142 (-) Transcript_29763:751-1176(-)
MNVPLESEFPDGPPGPCQSSYPFSIVIPNWLPSSCKAESEEENLKLSITYSIVAKFKPMNECDFKFYDKTNFRSKFLAFVDINVTNPGQPEPPQDRSVQVTSDVGGFLGMGRTEGSMQVNFECSEYYMGDVAVVHVMVDNS